MTFDKFLGCFLFLRERGRVNERERDGYLYSSVTPTCINLA